MVLTLDRKSAIARESAPKALLVPRMVIKVQNRGSCKPYQAILTLAHPTCYGCQGCAARSLLRTLNPAKHKDRGRWKPVLVTVNICSWSVPRS